MESEKLANDAGLNSEVNVNHELERKIPLDQVYLPKQRWKTYQQCLLQSPGSVVSSLRILNTKVLLMCIQWGGCLC